MVILCLIFWGTTTPFSIAVAPFYVPTSNTVAIFPHPLHLFFCFLMMIILMGMKWYFTAVSICIFQIISNVRLPFMCLLIDSKVWPKQWKKGAARWVRWARWVIMYKEWVLKEKSPELNLRYILDNRDIDKQQDMNLTFR